MQQPGIVPDTKNWTWVLERRCPECGFKAASVDRAEFATLIRALGDDWTSLHGEGGIAAGRRRPNVWSPLEYACHVRDVFRKYNERVAVMCAEDDPLYANWDQDATAVEDHYDEQDPAVVVVELDAAASQLAERLDALREHEWSRPGRRSDGISFTIESLCRYMVHDPIHHLWDVTGERP